MFFLCHLVGLVDVLHRSSVLLCHNFLLDFLSESLKYVVLGVGGERHLH